MWVCPAGQDELTKLTLTVLDYAFSPSAPSPGRAMKEVTWFFNKEGQLTTAELASQQVRANVRFDSVIRPPAAIQTVEEVEAASGFEMTSEGALEIEGPSEPATLPPILPPPDGGFSPLQQQLRLDFLTPPAPLPAP